MSQPIIQEIFFWLQFSSLVLVHLLLLVLIIATIKLSFSFLKLTSKTENAVEQVKEKSLELIQTSKEAAFNVSDLSNMFVDLFGYRQRRSLFQAIGYFFKK